MTDTVWKFSLKDEANKVAMPAGAEVLHVAEQHGQVALWARVNPATVERVTRTFHIVGTGTPVPDCPTKFCGTAMAAGGALVFHVFEEVPGTQADGALTIQIGSPALSAELRDQLVAWLKERNVG